jgi:AI-2E family transporter
MRSQGCRFEPCRVQSIAIQDVRIDNSNQEIAIISRFILILSSIFVFMFARFEANSLLKNRDSISIRAETLVVNSIYAFVVGIALLLIGIPNALLWAVLTLVLRFLPYVGLWISAFFPLVLSIAISTNWTQPILTILLYVILEVFTNNVIEPVVLGGSTGISPLAVIVSAFIWTWIWGPVGLLLATPITACLVVLGRYFPVFLPYNVMLAANPPTSTETKLLRLFTEDRFPEVKALVQELAGMQLSTKTAEELILPTVRVIEKDFLPGATASKTRTRIYGQMRQLIDELSISKPSGSEQLLNDIGQPDLVLVIVPFIREGDEVVGRILERLLEVEGIRSNLLSWRTLLAEKLSRLKELQARYVLLSATDPRSTAAVSKMAESLRELLPDAAILVGLWSLPPSGAARLFRKIKESAANDIYTDQCRCPFRSRHARPSRTAKWNAAPLAATPPRVCAVSQLLARPCAWDMIARKESGGNPSLTAFPVNALSSCPRHPEQIESLERQARRSASRSSF